MSHLDTAYQLGVKKAEEDFNIELRKAAQGRMPDLSGGGAPPVPGRGAQPVPAPPPQTRPTMPLPQGKLPGHSPSMPPAMPMK